MSDGSKRDLRKARTKHDKDVQAKLAKLSVKELEHLTWVAQMRDVHLLFAITAELDRRRVKP